MIGQYRTALMKGDTAALKRIWADDYTFINASGVVVTKAERLANLKSGATNLDTIEMDPNMKIRALGLATGLQPDYSGYLSLKFRVRAR